MSNIKLKYDFQGWFWSVISKFDYTVPSKDVINDYIITGSDFKVLYHGMLLECDFVM